MNPTPETKLETTWICTSCKKRFISQSNAELCCMCDGCGKRLATFNGGYAGNFCEPCWCARERKRLRESISRSRSRIKKLQDTIADEETEIAKFQTALVSFVSPLKEKP